MLKPEEHADGRARGSARDRALVRTLLTGAGMQAMQVFSAAIALPFAAHSLSPTEFGLLSVLIGLVVILALTDLGVGSALIGPVAQARARNDQPALRRAVGSALVVALIAGVVVLGLGITATLVAPWSRWLGASSVNSADLTASVVATVLAAALTPAASLGPRILFGVQRGHAANVWAGIGLVGSSLATVICAWSGAGLPSFVAASVLVPPLVGLACTAWVGRDVTGAGPVALCRHASPEGLYALVVPSAWFFVIAATGAIAYQTDTLVISAVLGAAVAGVYSVTVRVFALVSQVVYNVMLQFWPTVVEALDREDQAWVLSRFRLLTGGCATGGAAVCLVLMVVTRPLIGLWLTHDLVPRPSLVAAVAVWTAYGVATFPTFAVLNALGRVRLHAVLATAVCVVNLPVTIVLTHQIGAEGAVLASLACNFMLGGVPGYLVVCRLLRSDAPSPYPHRLLRRGC